MYLVYSFSLIKVTYQPPLAPLHPLHEPIQSSGVAKPVVSEVKAAIVESSPSKMKVCRIPIGDKDAKMAEKLSLNQRSIQCITAGASTESVYESNGQGVFTKYLLAALCGGAFSRHWITAEELTEWIGKRMKADPTVHQPPCFGCLSKDMGEFVFFRPRE